MWEEEDELDPEEFDPKVFFGLHGETLPTRLVGSGGGSWISLLFAFMFAFQSGR